MEVLPVIQEEENRKESTSKHNNYIYTIMYSDWYFTFSGDANNTTVQERKYVPVFRERKHRSLSDRAVQLKLTNGEL